MTTNTHLEDPLLTAGQLEETKERERTERGHPYDGAAKVLLTIIILLKIGIRRRSGSVFEREEVGEPQETDTSES